MLKYIEMALKLKVTNLIINVVPFLVGIALAGILYIVLILAKKIHDTFN